MEPTDYSAICIGAVVALGFLIAGARYMPRKWRKTGRRWFLVHLYHPAFPSCFRTPSKTKRLDALLFVLLVSGNVCSVVIGSSDMSDFSRRLGHAAMVNLVVLCFGGRMNPLVNKTPLRHERYNRLHKMFGALMMIESVLHSILSSKMESFDLQKASQVAGVIVSTDRSCGASAFANILRLPQPLSALFCLPYCLLFRGCSTCCR